jgi:hypothetical protein
MSVERTYFVGRRAAGAAEVYAITTTGVQRLGATRRHGEPSLDWRGGEAARMALSRRLLDLLADVTPSADA